MTYLLTFSCYGQRLHGDPRGSIHRSHNLYGSRTEPVNRLINAAEQRILATSPALLSPAGRELVLNAIIEVCQVRNWNLHAAHIRATHAHLVVTGDSPAKQMLATFKAYASRSLNAADGCQRPRWTAHGSTRYLWNSHSLAAACDYVINRQGDPMTVFVAPAMEHATT